ncbi:carbamoyltransferase C-terminal domain-containing protein [Streptomyces europaeiscabiei]|uniref:carbamoyltransferase C-terminal domain-containing protein n=1 Tax=Streptomyces europaeiscabiei TaxID=146819 RepID=UPI0029A29155|nr:carbamoyltransferase C-terminal domain-containing protein [Streptomyces europaeiscabiei]MDX3611296.1 carbamoyltransferase C-terminal domain-containing protein [Streptomyces europaeiscabiei]
MGINWEWHDSAAALVDGSGRVHACVEEERLTRVKHAWNTFPRRAAAACLAQAGIDWQDLDVVAVGWDQPHNRRWYFPARDRARLLQNLFGGSGGDRPKPEVVFVEHHLAHAASAFHASGFDEAGVLVVDGSGEFYSTSIYGMSRSAPPRALRHWPRGFSLGALYEAVTRTLGFGELDSGKTMGLASYGNASLVQPLPLGDLLGEERPFFDMHDATRYKTFVDAWMSYVASSHEPVTRPLDKLHQDPAAVALAARAQQTIEESIRVLHTETVRLSGYRQVCLAGGVALNCVANGQLPEPVFIPPFPHDAGAALGAAWSVCPPKNAGSPISPYLGTELPTVSAARLRDAGLTVRSYTPEAVVQLLGRNKIGAIAEGRAEVGPRALGHRSIIGCPSEEGQRDLINARKGREPWRPLAPVTLSTYASLLWPRQGDRERYMVGNATVSEHGRSVMPAAVHVDGSTRPQVLCDGSAPILESLLAALARSGEPPVLLNTSLNSRGQPIVESVDHVLEAFETVRLDFAVINDLIVERDGGTAT